MTSTAFRVLFFFVLSCSVFVEAHAVPPVSANRADEVLLVYNSASPVSSAIADYYAGARGITHVLSVDCQDAALDSDDETISIADYAQQIETPVSAYLQTHSGINFIVLTKGVPIRIDGGLTGSKDFGSDQNLHPSVDSYLAAIDYAARPDTTRISIVGSGAEGYGWLNRYWKAAQPFSHAAFGGYLVTRLDGYTQEDAIALVDRAIAAEAGIEPYSTVLLDTQPGFGFDDKTVQPLPVTTDIPAESSYGSWNGDLARAGDLLEASAVPALFDRDEGFVGNSQRLLGYFSWGSNDPSYTDAAYHSLAFVPGAIGDTAVSTSARTFLPTSGGQSLVADLVAQGITGVKGYVNEPLLQAIASPSVALHRYFSGYTLAESFYAASRFVGWEDVVLGDPLALPFGASAASFPIQASDFDASSGLETETCSEGGLDLGGIGDGAFSKYDAIDLTGMRSFETRVASPEGGAKIAVHIDAADGPLLGTCTAPATNDWQSYADTICSVASVDGAHDVYLVYTPGLNVQWFAFQGHANVDVDSLPFAWLETNVGEAAQSGSAIHSNAAAAFAVSGRGAGFNGSADAFHFVYRNEPVTSVEARVATLASGVEASAGIVLRSSLLAGAASAALVATTSGEVAFLWRDAEGRESSRIAVPAVPPIFLRLQRSDETAATIVTASYSFDGVDWSPLGSPETAAVPLVSFAGLAVDALDAAAVATATFDSVRFTSMPDAIFRDGFEPTE